MILWTLVSLLYIQLASANMLDLSGLPNHITNKIQAEVPDLIMSPITNEKADELIKWIFNEGTYQNASFVKSRINDIYIYKIRLVKAPTIDKINISGNKSVSKSKLSEVMGLEVGTNFDVYRLRLAIRKALEEMRKQSYLNAKVNTEIVQNGEQREINIIIDAGSSYKIGQIQIQNANDNLIIALEKISKRYINKDFTADNIEEVQSSIKNYLLANYFLSSSLENPVFEYDNLKGVVNVSLRINGPYKYKLEYNGNKRKASRLLAKALELESNDILGINPAADLSERLKNYYTADGYANIKISHKTNIDRDKYLYTINFIIEEGSKVKIRKYIIEGASAINQKAYINLIKEFSGDLIAKNTYNFEQLENGLQNLSTHMKNQGFISFRLLTNRVSFNSKKTKADIYIRIDEGSRSVINKINFKGLSAFTKENLLNVIELNEEQNLDLIKIEAANDKIKNLYRASGYLDISINENNKQFIKYFDNNTKADLNFELSEGQQIIVNQIEILGNQTTKANVIKRALDFKPDSILNSDSIQNSEASLRRLGIFNSVNIQHKAGEGPSRDIIVTVNERKPGTFTFGSGISNELEFTVRGYSGVAYRNLFGTARAIQTRGQLSANIKANEFIDYKVNASYIEPFLFNTQTKGKVNIAASQSLTSSGTTNLEAVQTTAMTFLTENDINRFLKLSWKVWGIERNRKFEVINENITEQRNIAEIGPILELDYRDSPFIPREGTYTRLNLDYSSPEIGSTEANEISTGLKTVNFLKTSLLFNQYMPVTKNSDIIFAYSMRGGYLKNLGNKLLAAVPQERLFFLGGVTTIRGFEYNSIPNKTLLTESGDNFASINNESYFYLLKLEMRIPIRDNFGLAVFYDGGGVQVQGKDLGDPYRDAVGLSLQYVTPIGAINLGYGYKLDRIKSSTESDGEIFFSIGDF